ASRVQGVYRHDPQADFIACAGDTTQDVLDTQIKHLDGNVGLITITIGGNDLGWTGEILNCVTRQFKSAWGVPLPGAGRTCKDILKEALDQRLQKYQTQLKEILTQIHAKAPNAKVIVVGYPIIMDPSYTSAFCGKLGGPFGSLGGPIIPPGLKGD